MHLARCAHSCFISAQCTVALHIPGCCRHLLACRSSSSRCCCCFSSCRFCSSEIGAPRPPAGTAIAAPAALTLPSAPIVEITTAPLLPSPISSPAPAIASSHRPPRAPCASPPPGPPPCSNARPCTSSIFTAAAAPAPPPPASKCDAPAAAPPSPPPSPSSSAMPAPPLPSSIGLMSAMLTIWRSSPSLPPPRACDEGTSGSGGASSPACRNNSHGQHTRARTYAPIHTHAHRRAAHPTHTHTDACAQTRTRTHTYKHTPALHTLTGACGGGAAVAPAARPQLRATIWRRRPSSVRLSAYSSCAPIAHHMTRSGPRTALTRDDAAL